LLCLENTQAGKALPLEYLARAHDFTRQHKLSLHLDGARVFNAAVKQRVDVREISRWFDTVSMCLSKGLGAPVGSMLCGSRELISKARRWRKVLGGGMRQAGVLAAAGIYALQNNVSRLEQDHENARALAGALAGVDAVKAEYTAAAQTNMVYMGVEPTLAEPLRQFLKQRGILVGGGNPIRLVLHMDVASEDVQTVAEAVRDFFASGRAARPAA
jgi:threonine aldolase